MTAGGRPRAGGLPLRRRALLPAPLLAAIFIPPTRAEETSLAAVMRGFAAIARSRAAFTEEKAVPELDLPLASQGTLAWQAPDRLEKRTVTPIQEVLQVEGSRLTYLRPDRGQRREFSLDEQPEMRALVEAIRGTLAGDVGALQRHYDIRFEAVPDGGWRMVLTPLSLRVRAAVQRILLSGRGPQILEMDTEGQGGVTRMRITPLP